MFVRRYVQKVVFEKRIWRHPAYVQSCMHMQEARNNKAKILLACSMHVCIYACACLKQFRSIFGMHVYTYIHTCTYIYMHTKDTKATVCAAVMPKPIRYTRLGWRSYTHVCVRVCVCVCVCMTCRLRAHHWQSHNQIQSKSRAHAGTHCTLLLWQCRAEGESDTQSDAAGRRWPGVYIRTCQDNKGLPMSVLTYAQMFVQYTSCVQICWW